MDAKYYKDIFKRRSFHKFESAGDDRLSEAELEEIRKAFGSFERLYPDIRTAIRIIPAKDVNFRQGAEYCILIYSEKKDNYLMNAGYIGEQLDLYLVDRNIGSLWYGLGKSDERSFDGLDYVIMIAVRKLSDDSAFRKDMSDAKRKALSEIWEGDSLGLAETVRFAPSAVNSQPWFVRNDGKALAVFRRRKPGLMGMIPQVTNYFNRIDMGIFLCILEICMAEKGIGYTRELFSDKGGIRDEFSKVAAYIING
ncbi:MAG: nitroreductase [Firmicutes bacterium]|nr:nitroreductase [Bacillota bacterium]